MTATQSQQEIRAGTPKPPQGWQRLKWYGPGLLWMISSVGSGSVLFTPRVGSRYQYAFLWAALIIIFFMWIMIREVGRYTVVTGKTLLDGYRELPGPKGWAIWLIFVPQIVAAVVTIAGIAALAGSALMIALPGNQAVYAVGLTLISTVLVISGHYKGVERYSSIMAGVLVVAVLVTATRVFPGLGAIGSGLVPSIPQDFDLYFVLPWLGFILAGAAGIVWFSYWVAAREYGGKVNPKVGEDHEEQTIAPSQIDPEEARQRFQRLQGWLRIMSTTAAIGVIGGGLIIVSFLILGSELLAPQGIVPEGIRVAEDLTRLLSQVWGAIGYWLLIVSIVIALWGTILADQDGWGRLFADATLILWDGERDQADHLETNTTTDGHQRHYDIQNDRQNRRQNSRQNGQSSFQRWVTSLHYNYERLKNTYIIITVTILPLIVFFLVRNPVDILSVGGIVAAIHTPVIVGLTLYVNKTKLPNELQPGWLATSGMVAAGAFFTIFAILYFLNLFGIQITQMTGGQTGG